MPKENRKRIEITVSFNVTERPNERYPKYGTAEELLKHIGAYVTHRDGSLRDDYGPEAWGGYDGAYITAAKILNAKIEAI